MASAQTEEKLRVEYMDLESLVKWDRNPKSHDIPSIVASIRERGFNETIIIDEKSGKIVSGHGRAEALQKMKEAGEVVPNHVVLKKDKWTVPILRGVSFKNKKEAEAYIIAANRIVELGGWHTELFHKILFEFKDDTDELLNSIGFDRGGLDQLLSDTDTDIQRKTNPKEQLEGFENATIKQIVLYLHAAEYDSVVARCGRLMESAAVDNHTELFTWMLDQCEQFKR